MKQHENNKWELKLYKMQLNNKELQEPMWNNKYDGGTIVNYKNII